MSSTDGLPPALSSMWRAVKRGYEAEPRLLIAAFGLSLLSALPDALLALWLKFLADGVIGGNRGLVMTAAAGLGVSTAATWFLRVISDRMQRRFRDQVTVALESHVARLQASVATIEHHERPEYLDRLAVLRNQVFVLDHMYMSLFSTCGWILRLGVTLALLVSIHPGLALLALFALPTVLTSTWRPGVERAVEERGASANRLARHLFDVATTAPPGKEVRVTRIGARLVADRRAAWEQWYRPVAAARTTSAAWHTASWVVFGAAYVAAVVFVSAGLSAAAGSVILVLAAGSRLSAYIAGTVGEIGFLRGIWLDGSRRLAWLEDYSASLVQHADAPVPEQLTRRNPLRARVVRVSRHRPTGAQRCESAVQPRLGRRDCRREWRRQDDVGEAVVPPVSTDERSYSRGRHRTGADAAGHLAIANLRCLSGFLPIRAQGAAHGRYWRPAASGRSTGSDGGRRARGRRRCSGTPRGGARDAAGSDVARRCGDQLRTMAEARPGTGVHARASAAARARRADRVARCGNRACAVSAVRCGRTRRPARESQQTSDGRITILVSHRFSTVRMADFIVVLDGSRVVESGTHEALLAKGGQYAELYSIQAAAYR